MITSKQAARLRSKKRAGKGLTPENERKLAEYDALGPRKVGRPASAEEPDEPSTTPDPVPEQEAVPEQTAVQPDAVLPPPPPPEVPPRVDIPKSTPANTNASAKSEDWREKWRKQIHFSDDGRQMICEQLAQHTVDALGALVDDMKKADVAPLIDPRAIVGMYVLAFDELLPARARLTPKIGAVLATTATVGQRAYHHKKITDALKDDPEVKEWKRQQAEREAKEQAQRAAHNAETEKTASGEPVAPVVQLADQSEPVKEATPINGQPLRTEQPEPPITRAMVTRIGDMRDTNPVI